MRSTLFGILVVTGLVAAATGALPARPQIPGQPGEAQSGLAESQLVVQSTVVEGRYQQLVVVDPRKSTLAVYHVDLASGNVELCCVRNISWDLQMTYFNGKNPLPPEIQSLLEHR